MKTVACIVVMITVTPIAAATGLLIYDPSNWGGEISVLNILGMAFFGLITPAVWITYIPTLLATPGILNDISKSPKFHNISLQKLITLSMVIGSLIGIFIVSPMIFLARSESIKLIFNWVFSGAFSGVVTYSILAMLYRRRTT